MANIYFATNCFYNNRYVTAGTTLTQLLDEPAVLGWYMTDTGTGITGPALPTVLPPNGGGPLKNPHEVHL